jgi:hypothetical protein
MREGKISRELVFEDWRVIQPAVDQMPCGTDTQFISSQHPAH